MTVPEHIARSCDECRREEIKCDWAECFGMVGERIGDHPEWQFRCHRKDLPPRKVVPVTEADMPPVPVVPKTRTVTLREYTIDNATVWTSAHWTEGTGRTTEVEVPE